MSAWTDNSYEKAKLAVSLFLSGLGKINCIGEGELLRLLALARAYELLIINFV
jgi:hypothetical protein